MRTLIIHADTGYASDAVFQFQRNLLHEGDECLMRQLGESWDSRAAVAGAEGFDLVVLSGGDYEVTRLLHALAGSETAICVFPSGPVNNFFSGLGVAAEPFALARACRMGATVEADLAEIAWIDDEGVRHRERFSLMAGSGFDAELLRAAASNRKAMGQAAYFLAAVANPAPPVIRFSIDVDGTRHQRDGIACIVANTSVIQGDIELVADCRLDDGLLDVIVLETPDAVSLIKPMLFGFLDPSGRNLGRPQIESFKGARVAVSASAPVALQVDGETKERTVSEFAVRVLPRAVRLIVDPMSPYYDEDAVGAPRFSGTELKRFPEP